MHFSIFFCFTILSLLNVKKLNPNCKVKKVVISEIEKIEGLLIGSVIGDAAGGPFEFISKERKFNILKENNLERIDSGPSFKLCSYPKKSAPYAQWIDYAPAGSVTDDTRFKMIFFRSLKKAGKICPKSFAKELLLFSSQIKPKYKDLTEDWLKEFKPAALWELGYTEDQGGLPPDRMWAGIPTMVGQMPFLPIATLFPGKPSLAYLKTWQIDFLDTGFSKDFQAAIVAGLAHALSEGSDWKSVEKVMRNTDPYKFGKAKYVQRRLNVWLDFAHEAVRRSNGKIHELFEILENEMNAHQYWEAWVPLVVVFACAEMADYKPLPALQLVIAFGHDTDSYAQLMGAFMGAINGNKAFPNEIQNLVKSRLSEQYNECFDQWMQLIYMHKL